MNDQLEQKLVTQYPELFADANKPPTESLMCFGCEHGDGWYDLINTLCRFISRTLDNRRSIELKEKNAEGHRYSRYTRPVFRFLQIKEKFGTLRVYYSLTQPEDPQHDKFIQSSIDEAYAELRGYIDGCVAYTEYLSGKTCEVCGKPGKTYSGGWISTKCPEHATEEQLLSDELELI